MEIEVTHLTKEDIITILNKAFELPWWNENNAIDIVDELYEGIGLFVKNGGKMNPSEYHLGDGDYILQYSLFRKLLYRVCITKTFIKDK